MFGNFGLSVKPAREKEMTLEYKEQVIVLTATFCDYIKYRASLFGDH